MLKSGFFNAQLVDGQYDRQYDASDFTNYFKTFISNGIFIGEDGQASTKMKVVSDVDVAMGIKVSLGSCIINGVYATITEEEKAVLDIPDGVYSRIDVIVMRLNTINRTVTVEVIKGDLADSPVSKPILRTDAIYDLKLAEVFVLAGSASIDDSNITDFRPNYDVCGWARNTLKQNNGVTAEENYEEDGEQKQRNIDWIGLKFVDKEEIVEGDVQEGQLLLQYEIVDTTNRKTKKKGAEK